MTIRTKSKRTLNLRGLRGVGRPSFVKRTPGRGRKAWVPQPRDFALIRQAAERGLTLRQAASLLGINVATLEKARHDYPEIDEAWDAGKSRGTFVIATALFNQAKAGNVAAQTFFLKNVPAEKWRSEPKDELLPGGVLGSATNPVNLVVKFTKPTKHADQALKAESDVAEIEHQN